MLAYLRALCRANAWATAGENRNAAAVALQDAGYSEPAAIRLIDNAVPNLEPSRAGWNETITSTQFTTGAPNDYTLATSASSLTGVIATNGTGTNTAATNAITYPVAVPAAAVAPAAVKFFNAAANTGMGRFTLTPTVGVFVPQSSFAGTYTSTLTIAIVSGP